MSLAIPSTYDQYFFDQYTRYQTPQMLCNGQIITQRPTGSQYQESVNWVNCLRGEDVFFLREAIFSRTSMTDYTYQQYLGVGMDNVIRARYLQEARNCLWNARNQWQQSELKISPHDFGQTLPDENAHDVENYIFTLISGIGNGAQTISFISGSRLAWSPIYNLMTEVRKMNYSVDATHCVTTSWNTEHTAHWDETNQGQQISRDVERTDLWISDRKEDYTNTSSLVADWNLESIENTLNIDLFVEQNDAWVKVADYLPLGLVKVTNTWSWYNTTYGQSEGEEESHYVLVPLSDNYLTIQGGGAHLQGLRTPMSVIADAFTTAGLEQYADDIQMGSSPTRSGTWGWRNWAQAQIERTYNLVHYKYCVP